MKDNRVPNGIMKWIEKNQDKVVEYWMENDHFAGEWQHPYSIWLYFTPGWICNSAGVHLIHEFRVADFLSEAADIVPCDCESCQKEKQLAEYRDMLKKQDPKKSMEAGGAFPIAK